MRNLQTKVAEKIETIIICSATFPEHFPVYEIMWRNMVQADGRTDGPQTAHAHCMLDN
jgi:hypothetical protein